MRFLTLIIAFGSGAAGFGLAALSLTHSPRDAAPAAAAAATSAAEKSGGAAPDAAVRKPSGAVLAEITAAMAGDAWPETVKAWAERDPNAFLHWLRHARPQPSWSVVEGFFDAWKKTDARAACRAACELPERFGLHVYMSFA